MKAVILQTLAAIALVTVFVTVPLVSHAEIDISKDFDSLGGNEALYKRAKALDPKNKVSIVQKRVVDRTMRLELGINYGIVGGGDSYLNTQNVGGNLDFHISPYISVGGRFYNSYNHLTAEGQDIFSRAQELKNQGINNYEIPDLNQPQQTALATVSVYPIYGKTNLFDAAVVQFDFYALAGYGGIKLSKTGWTDAITGGGGMGLWLSQHVASRIEGRWETYADVDRRINAGIFTVGVGLLL
jgi:outer membrane beta-barrel protein